MTRLYPPIITGTIPSFYTDNNGTTKLVVPFSMNKSVDKKSFSSMRLRVKTVNTDTLILETNTTEIDDYSLATFYISPPEGMVAQNYYKIQIAYCGETDLDVGYFSSVGLIKYTEEPSVVIAGFTSDEINFNISNFVGEYYNNDSSEKVQEYCFTLLDEAGNILETSGWRLHNSYSDEDINTSTDLYNLHLSLADNTIYRIKYVIRTNNGMEISSPGYYLQSVMNLDAQIQGKIDVKLDYNNASVKVYLTPALNESGLAERASGTFILSRASSLDNYSSWTQILEMFLTGDFPSEEIFTDYTIESGITYKYALQQKNDYGIISGRNIATDITIGFEDAFLYDGERQLKIQFNSKITSFKEVVSETKKNTIGYQYPFIFRNGAIKYKEFPISGLISYLMDEQECFLKKEDIGYDGWIPTVDYSDENIALERIFKLKVLEWLNNGQPKLFRSPQEGNYIIRLMSVSLTPFDKTGRMIHTFAATANEIAEATPSNFVKYKFLNTIDVVAEELRWETVKLSEIIPGKDIFNGNKCYYIKITNARPGTFFKLGNLSLVIGATGQYEAQVDAGIGPLIFDIGNSKALTGEISYAVITKINNKFNAIKGTQIKNIAAKSISGQEVAQEIFKSYIKDDGTFVWNITDEPIIDAPKVFYLSFHKKEIQELVPNHDGPYNEYMLYHDPVTDKYKIYDEISNSLKEISYSSIQELTEVYMEHETIPINGSEIKYYSTKFNIGDTEERYIKAPDTKVTSIKIGPGVFAILGYQLREIVYAFENNEKLQQAYENYCDARENYLKVFFDLEEKSIPNKVSHFYYNRNTDNMSFQKQTNSTINQIRWIHKTNENKEWTYYTVEDQEQSVEAYHSAYVNYRTLLLKALEESELKI